MATQNVSRTRVYVRKQHDDGVDLEALTWAFSIVFLACWIGIHL
jgi:hypothetical protein